MKTKKIISLSLLAASILYAEDTIQLDGMTPIN